MSIDPIRLFEVNKQVSTLQTAVFNSAVANNQLIVTAVSGQRIRVMGFTMQSAAAQGNPIFKNGSGGAYISAAFWAPASTLPPFVLPVTDSGYFETTTGTGLYADVATAIVYMNVFYITYTPV